MEAIKQAFTGSKAQCRSVLITYLRAGCPTVEETPEIMLAMQAGGAGIYWIMKPPTRSPHSTVSMYWSFSDPIST